jgi:hypothetical protein
MSYKVRAGRVEEKLNKDKDFNKYYKKYMGRKNNHGI